MISYQILRRHLQLFQSERIMDAMWLADHDAVHFSMNKQQSNHPKQQIYLYNFDTDHFELIIADIIGAQK
jgi:hypothetical protein